MRQAGAHDDLGDGQHHPAPAAVRSSNVTDAACSNTLRAGRPGCLGCGAAVQQGGDSAGSDDLAALIASL
jgi:hypothetical protein